MGNSSGFPSPPVRLPVHESCGEARGLSWVPRENLGGAQLRASAGYCGRCPTVDLLEREPRTPSLHQSPGQLLTGLGVPLAPGSGGPATRLVCRGHGGSQPGLWLVKSRDKEDRQRGATPGLGAGRRRPETTWIWLFCQPGFYSYHWRCPLPTSGIFCLRAAGGSPTGASQWGPSLTHRSTL